MPGRFTNKVCLVTGGASGIGKTTAKMFAREGAKVVITDLSEINGQETVREIEQMNGTAVFIRTDVSKAGEVENLIRQTVETHGRLDCAFNNAGIDHKICLPHELTEDDFDQVISVNLKGIWLCMKYELTQMLKQGSGVIINMSSVAGLVGAPGLAGYSASKGAVNQLTKTAALDYAKMGIRVNALCPGPVASTGLTDNLQKNEPEAAKMLAQGVPIGRYANPEEIARAALWLCSDEASYITGVCLPVDGAMRA